MEKREIIQRAKDVIAGTKVGLMATLGENGAPDMRWMATHTLLGPVSNLYTITAPDSNKVAQLEADARVTWLFSRVNYTEIVKLFGTAFVEDDPLLKSRVWDVVGRRTERYFTIHDGRPDFAVLVTRATELEYMAPIEGLYKPVRVTLEEEA